MKKVIAILLTLVLSLSIIVPASAEGEVYMIFNAETDDGCGVPGGLEWGCEWGPVAENEDLGHPAPVQGTCSYCLCTYTDRTILSHNLDYNPGVTTTGTFDATKYEYIELDIYSGEYILFNWQFGICSKTEDAVGSTWGMENVCIPAGRWTHIKMPISEFGDFPEAFPDSSLDNINRIRMQLTNIVDLNKLTDDGVTEAPYCTYIYFDNVIATTGDAGGDNELITLDEYLAGPPEWWPVDPILPPWPKPQPPKIIWGDVDDDGDVDADDALKVLHHSIGKVTLTGVPLAVADVNKDDEVDTDDALLILHYSIGKIEEFPEKIPLPALPDTLMVYDCETDEGCSDPDVGYGRYWGPVSENVMLGHPKPVQGEYSNCFVTDTNKTILTYDLPEAINLSEYDYIELDVYCSWDIVCNWDFGLASRTTDSVESTYNLNLAWLPMNRWTHIKMPISAFTELSNVNRLKIQLTDIIDRWNMELTGEIDPPDYTYLYFDNIVATKNGAGEDNELIDIDTLYGNPPEWYEEYMKEVEEYFRTCGGLEPPAQNNQ